MSQAKKKPLAEELAEELVLLIDNIRTAKDDDERETLRKSAVSMADRLQKSGLGVDTREHARRVRFQILRAFRNPDSTGRPRERLMKEAAADASTLVGAINRTGRPITDLEKTIKDPEELVALILKDIRYCLDYPGKNERERRFPQVRKAAEIIERTDGLDDDAREVALAVTRNFAEANAWHGWEDNGEAAAHYLQVAEEHAFALRDAIRARPGPDERPGRRGS